MSAHVLLNLSNELGKIDKMRGLVFKQLPRDPASVNAMKQTCVIVILACLPDFSINRAENVL